MEKRQDLYNNIKSRTYNKTVLFYYREDKELYYLYCFF